MFDKCQVQVMNLRNESVKCDSNEYLDTAHQEFQQRSLSLSMSLTQNQNITEANISDNSDNENSDEESLYQEPIL
ncbi:9267_t:CDS:2 [Dentiscutata erythropus]|uniref:9267_t:CDS:1 n=1 Tax=Dentiscutata erythropus TaxID=1348616 RepID=A0A9N9GI97_9GLOM|nr:9267_t:CDS:2 [Dentiscutata erythropus]